MRVPFTWKPTGWFMVGWSADFTAGTTTPLQYLGGHQVAYRTEDGELHVLDAHCPHLGAHIGHGGKVQGDCVVCPYHGWGYGPDGVNKFIPYDDKPNVSHSLKVWPVVEKHGCVFIWHDPNGGQPRWELPDLFSVLPHLPADPADYYRAYPELSVKYEREPVHPYVVVLEARARPLQRAHRPLAAVVVAEPDLPVVVDAVRLVPQHALPLAGLLQQVPPGNRFVM